MKLHSHKLMLLALIGLTLLSISIQPVKCDGNDLLEDQLAQPEPKQQQQPSFLQRFKLPKMFDFEEYKKLFKRSYHGLEEIVRRKLMLARALRAWISSLKYKYGQSSFYLAVNEFSDQTPEELQRMVNHHIVDVDENHEEPPHQVIFNTDQSSIPQVDSNHIEEELGQLASENLIKDDVGSLEKLEQELKPSGHDRKRRDVSQSPGARVKALEKLAFYKLPIDKDSQENVESFFKRHSRRKRSERDRVLVDHRSSDCMFVPRRQRQCGSCYAFAMIAYAEWLFCKLTGEPIAFSEQYIIDCGSPHLVDGCNGGDVFSTAKFIHNYGLELNTKYPYRMMDDSCPYSKQTHHKAMGRIRMDFTSAVTVPIQMFHKVIKYTPIYIYVSMVHDFQEYGGGVMDGHRGQQEDLHAVLLIGHGRKDGREYWIVRNSFGPHWGEEGHFRLAKAADLIHLRQGYLFGTHDVVNFDFEPKLNQLNDPSHVEAHNRRRA